MKKISLVLIGGGGHCKACIDVIEQLGNYKIIGILDKPELVGKSVLNYSIVGTDADIDDFIRTNCTFMITVGQIKSSKIRRAKFDSLINAGAKIATIISPLAYVSKYAKLNRGTIVMHGVNVNAGAIIGENVILNTGCNIEHDAVIGCHTHISTQVVVNGQCVIGDDVFIGSNATISNHVSVKDNCIIGAGTVVHKDIPSDGRYVGNPFFRLNSKDE